MKITFKNVGQGDSILLEWQRDTESHSRIGIIDCKKIGNINPTLEHIKKISISKIDFIVLSHPHHDHYSGMLELLDYCEEKGIRINKFINSAGDNDSYLHWFGKDDNDSQKLLEQIYNKCIHMFESELINSIGKPFYGMPLRINNDFTIFCLSPSDAETALYYNRVELYREVDEQKASQWANVLSTVFLIKSNEEHYCILTSDATIEVFDRIRANDMHHLGQSRLLLSQIPHHGSKDNHQIRFWNQLTYQSNTPAIISAGKHGKYNHPHKIVINDFYNHNYKVYSTNSVNGMADFMTERESGVSMYLNMISNIIEKYEVDGDQVFKLTPNDLTYIPNNN